MESLPDRSRSHAVLIGTSRFDHLPSLPAVRNNLDDLRAALTDPEHGVLAPENCRTLDNPPTARAFMSGLRQVVDKTDDFLFVYYAGHGLRHTTKDELYLSVGETEEDALDESAVRFERVKEVLENGPARRSLLVLDCCYSGMALGTMSGLPVEQREIEVRGSAVLASSPRNKRSHSPVGQRNTAFTGKMITFLEHGSPVAGEALTVQSLYKRVSVALVKEEFPRPLIKLTDTSGDLLVRRPAVTLEKRWEPPTVPRTRPVVAPVRPTPLRSQVPAQPRISVGPPKPAADHRPTGSPHPAAPAGAVPGGVAAQSRVRSLQFLWVLTGLFAAMGLGGLVGVILGEKPVPGSSSDAESIMISGSVLTAVLGGVLALLRHRWGDLGRAHVPPILTRLPGGRGILVVGAAMSLLLAILGPLTEDPNKRTPSTTTAAAIVLVECAAACVYLLLRGGRIRRRTNRR